MRRALLLLVLSGCFLSRSAADSPTTGEIVTDYRYKPFEGGSVHDVVLVQTVVAEWITNEYDLPITLDIARATTGLRPDRMMPDTIVIPAHATVRAGVWQIENAARYWTEQSFFIAQPGDRSAVPTPYAYGLPFPAGEAHVIGQGFHGAFSHTGDSEFAIDFDMPEGTIVRAARDGTVVGFSDVATGGGTTPEWKEPGRANWLFVLHADGTIGEYWHLAPHGVLVTVGQHVARGDAIARSGNTGFTQGPHLHFAVRTAASGSHARTFPFTLRTAPGVEEAPVEGKRYTAFE